MAAGSGGRRESRGRGVARRRPVSRPLLRVRLAVALWLALDPVPLSTRSSARKQGTVGASSSPRCSSRRCGLLAAWA
ncbi:MAG: hypothetical protein ACK55I_30320, partial [bacterium]